jgi:hypothetical protein
MPARSPEDCTYIFPLKTNPERVPPEESLHGPAKLVCKGDPGYPFPQADRAATAEKTQELVHAKALPAVNLDMHH